MQVTLTASRRSIGSKTCFNQSTHILRNLQSKSRRKRNNTDETRARIDVLRLFTVWVHLSSLTRTHTHTQRSDAP